MADNNGERWAFFENRVRELRDMIAKSVKEPTLCTHLLSSGVITDQNASKVRLMMQNDTYNANLELLDYVFISDMPGKWPAFLDAIAIEGYEDIRLELLSPRNDDEDPINQHILSIMQQFTKELADGLKGVIDQMVPILRSKQVLSQVDEENIYHEQGNKGNYSANLMLIDRMKSRATPRTWYCTFLQALLDVGYEHLVETMEPKFISNKDDFLGKYGATEYDHCVNKMKNASITETVLYDRVEGATDTNNLAPPPIPPRTYSLDESIHEQSGNENLDSNTKLKEMNAKPDMGKNIELGTDARADDDGESSDDNSMASDYEDNQHDASNGASKYTLRSYQVELAEDAIGGKNTIICSETGTGKTWVALEIIKKHFETAARSNKKLKVAFMARTSILVKQQGDRFKRFLPMYKTKILTGEDQESNQLNMYMDMNDIICFTPQILVNNLDIKSVKSVSEFSMLILDECHHTRGDEPYNRLMRRYLVEKSQNAPGLPQIVGLTASIGVGKSRTDEEAIDYILRVMACLDVRILSTVEKNIVELKQHTNMPDEETIPLAKPEYDPCKDVLLIAIEETEDLLDDHALMQPNIIDLIAENKPREKESPAYNKWTVDLFKASQLKVDDLDISRDICACARYLNTYNSALEINKLLRSKDVIKFLAEKHQNDMIHKDKHTEMEKTLFNKLLDVQKNLQKKGRDTENPNVRTLSDTLKNMLDGKGEDSRALVFVKARATCRSLADFLLQDLKKYGYKTSPLYGKENRGGDAGMTESVQTDILEKFRRGFYKVLVCTSVGNEGIDVPQCNIVLSYEYSGDEITKIQMKGRARQMDATVTLMADEKMIEQDRINAYKAAMMYRALRRIKGLNKRYVEGKVRQFQTDEMTKYRFQVQTENYKKGRQSEDDHDILCGRCSIRACFVSDVRCMGSNYIVIDKDFRGKVERKEHKRPKTYDGLHKKYKMFCKKCGLDWGIIGICKGLDCHILKIENLKFRNHRTQGVQVYKKWLDQPYRVQEMTPDDVPRLLGDN